MREPISVCMTSYNGEQYIKRQIWSILPQLKEGDELLIVDDGSTDDTLSIIESIEADCITLIKNDMNLGYVKNFEKAIYLSKNEIIFLSDQDDEWLNHKIENVLNVFNQNKTIDIVYHDALLVDGESNQISKSWWEFADLHPRRGFWWNYYKNSFSGCMMAIRRKPLLATLPFPSDIEYHDQWIALVLMKNANRFFIMDSPQMKYTRHGKNMSGVTRNPTYIIIWKKILLFFRISMYKKSKDK